jgi:hypothetical protein
LAAEPFRKVVSTFKSLPIAERTLYQGIRANRTAIETWAISARPGDKFPFQFMSNEVVGQVLVKATNKLHDARKIRFVLKMEPFKGKLYYILTAFPEL